METTFDKKSNVLASLKIVLGPDDYEPEVKKKIKSYAKTAQIKGFRPGHVPEGYVKKLYGKSILVDEVIHSVSKQVNTYLKENELNVVGDPMPNNEAYQINWDTDKEFTFEYEVGLASDFEVSFDKAGTIINHKIDPTEEQVDKAIEDLQKRFGEDVEPEVVQKGDLVFGKLEQEETEFSTDSGIPTDKIKEDAQKLFVGLEKGSSITFDIQSLFNSERELGFATGKSDQDAAALSGNFTFTVNKISRVEPAALDQNLFDKAVGPEKVKTLEEFKEEVKRIISENYSRESNYLLEYELEQALLKTADIELPEEFLKKWLDAINEGKFSKEEIDKDYPSFERGLKLDLIKTQIAKKNDIKIEYADVLEEAKAEIAGYFGGQMNLSGMEGFITQMAEKQLKENKDNAASRFYNKAFGKKVVSFSKDKFTLVDKVVKVEEFNEIAQKAYEMA